MEIDDESISMVLEGLQQLIARGAKATVSRMYSPSGDPDNDDDVIRDGKNQVKQLRRIRSEFETLMFGISE